MATKAPGRTTGNAELKRRERMDKERMMERTANTLVLWCQSAAEGHSAGQAADMCQLLIPGHLARVIADGIPDAAKVSISGSAAKLTERIVNWIATKGDYLPAGPKGKGKTDRKEKADPAAAFADLTHFLNGFRPGDADGMTANELDEAAATVRGLVANLTLGKAEDSLDNKPSLRAVVDAINDGLDEDAKPLAVSGTKGILTDRILRHFGLIEPEAKPQKAVAWARLEEIPDDTLEAELARRKAGRSPQMNAVLAAAGLV